jgi:hypothetical protein
MWPPSFRRPALARVRCPEKEGEFNLPPVHGKVESCGRALSQSRRLEPDGCYGDGRLTRPDERFVVKTIIAVSRPDSSVWLLGLGPQPGFPAAG